MKPKCCTPICQNWLVVLLVLTKVPYKHKRKSTEPQHQFPPRHTLRIIRRKVKWQPFLMCPGWSSPSPIFGTIYDTSLDIYI